MRRAVKAQIQHMEVVKIVVLVFAMIMIAWLNALIVVHMFASPVQVQIKVIMGIVVLLVQVCIPVNVDHGNMNSLRVNILVEIKNVVVA